MALWCCLSTNLWWPSRKHFWPQLQWSPGLQQRWWPPALHCVESSPCQMLLWSVVPRYSCGHPVIQGWLPFPPIIPNLNIKLVLTLKNKREYVKPPFRQLRHQTQKPDNILIKLNLMQVYSKQVHACCTDTDVAVPKILKVLMRQACPKQYSSLRLRCEPMSDDFFSLMHWIIFLKTEPWGTTFPSTMAW